MSSLQEAYLIPSQQKMNSPSTVRGITEDDLDETLMYGAPLQEVRQTMTLEGDLPPLTKRLPQREPPKASVPRSWTTDEVLRLLRQDAGLRRSVLAELEGQAPKDRTQALPGTFFGIHQDLWLFLVMGVLLVLCLQVLAQT